MEKFQSHRIKINALKQETKQLNNKVECPFKCDCLLQYMTLKEINEKDNSRFTQLFCDICDQEMITQVSLHCKKLLKDVCLNCAKKLFQKQELNKLNKLNNQQQLTIQSNTVKKIFLKNILCIILL